MVRLLARVMGIGIETADMLVQEVLSRNLRDRRAVARAGLHGLSRRNREWVRRFGASQPMRMTASWFGSLDPPNTRLWRDRSALERGLPSNRHLAGSADCIQWCSRTRNFQVKPYE